MLDSSSDSRNLSWRSRLAAALHWRCLIRLPLKLPGLCVRIVWIAFFILAVGFLLLRYVAAPQISQYRERIEQEISHELGLKVRMASLQANWDGLRPELAIRDMRVYDEQDRVALELPRIEVSVAWTSLLHWRLTLHRLEIDRPQLSIRRQADGSLLIAGIRIKPSGGGSSGFGDFVLAQHEIVIRQAKLTWTDEKRHAPPLSLDKVNLRIENFARSHRFALLASPPRAYSANLDIRGDLHGHGFEHLADWRGQLYLSLDEADLAVWQKWLDYPLVLPRGRGGMRAWVNFNGPHLTGLTADVALADVSMRFAKKLPMLNLKYLKGHLKMTADAHKIGFVAQDLSLATQDGVQIGPTHVGLDYTLPESGRMSKGRFASGEIDVRMLAQLAGYLPLPDKVARALVATQPRGRIHQVQLEWQGHDDKVAHFAVDADLQDLSLRPFDGVPGVDKLSIKAHGTERSGNFKLSMHKGALHAPAALHEGDVPIDALDIGGRWGYEQPKQGRDEQLTVHVDSGRFGNPHIDTARFSGYWQARATGSGYMDLQARAGRLSLENLWRYMPLHSAKFVPQWMHTALRGGYAQNIRFHMAGELDHIPFHKYPGIFHLESRLVDAKLDTFAPGWPGTQGTQGTFEMDRQRVTIMITRGLYGGVTVGDTKVEIPDIMAAGKQILTVDGIARGSTPAFLSYINASRLGDQIGKFTREVKANGPGTLQLHLHVPLQDSKNTKVKGSYRFKNNMLKLVAGLPEFTDATGTLGFTEDVVSLSDTDALFLGKRIHARGETEADGTLRFNAQGMIGVPGLRKLVPNQGWRHLSGESAAEVTVWVRHAQTDIAVESKFIGISSDLPKPLRKTAAERWPVRVNLRVDSSGTQRMASTQSWRLSLDSILDASWVEKCWGESCTISRGAIGMRESAILPDKGWNISGNLKTFDVSVWQPVLDEILPDSDASSREQKDVVVTAKLERLLAEGRVFHQVRTKAMLHNGAWTAHFDGPDLAGDVNWQGRGNGRLRARLTRLSLQKAENGSSGVADSSVPSTSPDTASKVVEQVLPDMDVVVDAFQLHNMKLGKLTLLANNQNDQWLVKHVALSDSDMDLSAQGAWLNGHTQLDFHLSSNDAGSMLGHFGLSNSIQKGKLNFSGELDWQGLPYAPDLPSLDGDLKLKVVSGAFVEMEPGAFGRLLGIMSLQALPRRLMGNFDDVIAKGFAFDSIQGEMHVDAGVLHMTKDLEVRGPAAKVFISGSTDLIHESHNLVMRVQPTMSDPVSLGVVAGQLAAGVANPVLGIGLLVGQKIVGDPLEKIFSYDLSVTGPWSDPKVEKKAEKLEDRLESIAEPASAPAAEASGATSSAP